MAVRSGGLKKIMNKRDLMQEIAFRTGYVKQDVWNVLSVIEDIISDNIKLADSQERSAISWPTGVTIGGKWVPLRQCIDPRNNEPIMIDPKFLPYCTFSRNYKNKINIKTEDAVRQDELYDEYDDINGYYDSEE